MKLDVYGIVTARIMEQLEQSVIPCEKPWTGIQSGAISGATGRAYSLLNQMLLGRPGEYFTFNQVKERGGNIRKGEKSSIIVFWKQVKVTEQNKNGEEVEKLVPMLRYYTVFHISQCEGLTAREPIIKQPPINKSGEDIITAYINREHILMQHVKGDKACYSPGRDCITLPLREQFPNLEEYYCTAFS